MGMAFGYELSNIKFDILICKGRMGGSSDFE